MNCESAQDLLECMCLGGDCGDAAEELAGHLESCRECRSVQEQLKVDIARDQSQLMNGSIPAFEEARKAVHAEAVRARAGQRRRRIVGMVLKSAAVFAVVGGLAIIFLQQSPSPAPLPQPKHEQLTIRWTTSQIGDTIATNRPLVAGPRVFVLRNYSNLRFVAALNRETGVEEWLSGFPVVTAPLMGDGNLLAWRRINGKIRLSAVDLETGKELWGYEPEVRRLWQKPPTAMVNAHVVCWSVGRRIWSLDARSGEVCWQKKLASSKGRLSVPRILKDRVAVADGRILYLLDAKKGNVTQKVAYATTKGFIPGPMVEGDANRLYISQHAVGEPGNLYCCDINEGKMLWSCKTRRPTSFQVIRDRAYVRSNIIQAFDCGTGKLMWSNDVDGCSPVSVQRDRVYVIRSKKRREIVTLNSNTGRRDAVFPLPDGSCAGMTIADGSSYISTYHGRIYAIALPH